MVGVTPATGDLDRLLTQHDRDLQVRADVIPDEQHATVWPTAFTRGLVHLYLTGPRAQP